MIYLLLLGCVAFFVSYPLTRAIVTFAPSWGFVDRPDGHHKSHQKAVALGGGLAVFLAAAVTFMVEYVSSSRLHNLLGEEVSLLGGLLLASAWIVGLGLFDDRFGMKGRYKLIGQVVAAAIVIASGLQIKGFFLFGLHIELGMLSIPFTIFWLLGAINSLNLLDGIDGLATTIGIILCSTIVVMAMMIGHHMGLAIVAAVFVGSLVGFLKFNFPPAAIYLGDAGSMLIGLVVGTLAIGSSLKGPATVALAAPLAIWALPMFDSFIAILRRKLVGRSIYATDRGHLHHRLMTLFGKNTRVLAAVAVCCTVTCVGALLSLFMKNDLIALGAVAAVFCMLIATQAFGHIELKMLFGRIKLLLLALIYRTQDHEISFQMQGTRQWEVLWRSVVEFGEKMGLVDIKLDINLASIQESYHASWRRASKIEKQERWHTVIPLMAGEHLIGRLAVSGCPQAGLSTCEAIKQLLDMLEPIEAEIVAMAGDTGTETSIPVTVESETQSTLPIVANH